ncbi:MAG: hypothetical protein LBP96_01695, partial [Bacteroidales bacterium]|nr:hypothetical protein [Bacteroidales bacterium]
GGYAVNQDFLGFEKFDGGNMEFLCNVSGARCEVRGARSLRHIVHPVPRTLHLVFRLRILRTTDYFAFENRTFPKPCR